MKEKVMALTLFIVISFMQCFAQSTEADFEPSLNYNTNIFTVTGNTAANTGITIIVFNPNGSLTDLKSDDLQNFKRVFSDANGKFTYQFELSLDGENDTGDYAAYVKPDGGNYSAKKEVYIADSTLKGKVINSLTGGKTASELKVALSNLSYVKTLGLGAFAPFSSVNLDGLCVLCAEKLAQFSVTDNINSDIADLQEILKQYSVLELYNEGKSANIYKSDGSILYSDIIGMDGLDVKYSVTLKKAYDELLSESAKGGVKSELLSKSFTSPEKLCMEFAKQVVLCGLSSPKITGYDHVAKILTINNVEFIGITLKKTIAENSAIEIAGKSKCTSVNALQSMLDGVFDNTGGGTPGSSGGSPTRKGTSVSGGDSIISIGETVETAGEMMETADEFADLGNYEWARASVKYLKQKGIIDGVSKEQFAPEENLSREQLVKVICITFGIAPSNDGSGFTDVDSGSWYAPYISAANKAGLVNGVSENSFGVEQPITREDLAVILYRSAKLSGGSLEFSDTDDISDYAREAAAALFEAKIITGYEDNTFRPKNYCTRAEMAKIIYCVLML